MLIIRGATNAKCRGSRPTTSIIHTHTAEHIPHAAQHKIHTIYMHKRLYYACVCVCVVCIRAYGAFSVLRVERVQMTCADILARVPKPTTTATTATTTAPSVASILIALGAYADKILPHLLCIPSATTRLAAAGTQTAEFSHTHTHMGARWHARLICLITRSTRCCHKGGGGFSVSAYA